MPQPHMAFLALAAREPGLSREQADAIAGHLSAYEQQLAAFLDLWASSFTTERLQQECLLFAPAGPLLHATCAALTALPQVGCRVPGWRGTAHISTPPTCLLVPLHNGKQWHVAPYSRLPPAACRQASALASRFDKGQPSWHATYCLTQVRSRRLPLMAFWNLLPSFHRQASILSGASRSSIRPC